MSPISRIINFKELLRPFLSWNGLWLVLFFIGTGIFFIGMPKYVDDYWYMYHLRPWFEIQGINVPSGGGDIWGYGIPWEGIYETWVERYFTDNTRLGNMLVMFFLLLPKWVGSGLMTLLWIYIVIVSIKITGIDIRRSAMVPVALFLWTYGLFWGENYGSLDYQFNYLLSLGFAMMLLQRLFNIEYIRTLSQTAVFWGIGLLLGLSHEGVAVPIICGIGILAIFTKRFRTFRVWGVIGFIVAGLLVLLTAPGMTYRMDATVNINSSRFLRTLTDYSFPVFLLFIVMSARILLSSKGINRRLSKDAVLMFCIMSSTVSFMILLLSDVGSRGAIWMSLIAVSGILRIIKLRYGDVDYCRNRAVKFTSFILLGLVFVRWAFVDIEALRYRKEFNAMVEWYASEEEGSYFGYYNTVGTRPSICGYLPEYRIYGYNAHYMDDYWGHTRLQNKKYGVIVPEALRYADENLGRRLEGGNSIRETEGYYFMPDSCDGVIYSWSMIQPVLFDFGYGYKHGVCWSLPFKSQKDNRWYKWLIPWKGWFVVQFIDIKGMKTVDELNV